MRRDGNIIGKSLAILFTRNDGRYIKLPVLYRGVTVFRKGEEFSCSTAQTVVQAVLQGSETAELSRSQPLYYDLGGDGC